VCTAVATATSARQNECGLTTLPTHALWLTTNYEHLYLPEAAQRKEILTLKILNTDYYQVKEVDTLKITQKHNNVNVVHWTDAVHFRS